MKERLKKFIEYQGLSTNLFETKICVGRGVINRYLREDCTFSAEILVKIGQTYKDLNMNWLINGRGSMFCDEINVEDKPDSEKNRIELMSMVIDAKDELIETLKDRVDKQNEYLTELTKKYIETTDDLRKHKHT